MSNADPLTHWLYLYDMMLVEAEKTGSPDVSYDRHIQAKTHEGLEQLAKVLDEAGKKKPKYSNVPLTHKRGTLNVLAEADIGMAEQLYRQVLERNGPGHVYVQEALLHMIAQTASPATIPFWTDMVYAKGIPPYTFASQRRTLALAALAFIAIYNKDEKARETLLQISREAPAEVRGHAIHYLARSYLEAEEPFALHVIDHFKEVAVQDKAFLSRLNARVGLLDAEEEVPMDLPGGVFEFTVSFSDDKEKTMYRTVALRSEQTLYDLHLGIQHALGWGADHLYSFFMNGELWDARYEFGSTEHDDVMHYDDQGVIGQLGFVPYCKFLYFFDYGDNHMFDVRVTGQQAEAEADREYPCVVDSQGDAPVQYPVPIEET